LLKIPHCTFLWRNSIRFLSSRLIRQSVTRAFRYPRISFLCRWCIISTFYQQNYFEWWRLRWDCGLGRLWRYCIRLGTNSYQSPHQ
jgi:hypothetical protein